jgi:hypothetical protein
MVLATIIAFSLPALTRGAAPIDNALLKGEYIGKYTRTCLVTIEGFDTSTLEPNVPNVSHVASDTWQGIWVFDGRGSFSETGTVIYIPSVAAEPSNTFTPNASGSDLRGAGKYTVNVDDEVVVTVTGESGKFSAGVNRGQTFTVGRYALAGNATRDGATVILATPEPRVETTSYGGNPYQRICERSVVLARKH